MKTKLTGKEKVFVDCAQSIAPIRKRNYNKPVSKTPNPLLKLAKHIDDLNAAAEKRVAEEKRISINNKRMLRFDPSEVGLDNPLKIINSIVAGVCTYEFGYEVHAHNKRITDLCC